MSWYIMYVQTRHEDIIYNQINSSLSRSNKNIQYQLLIPKRKITERKNAKYHQVLRNLFPGYIFVNTEQIIDFYYSVISINKIYKFIKVDNDFLEVKQDEIDSILDLVNNEGVIEISEACNTENGIKILNGPLYKIEGKIRKIDKRKGRARVEFLIQCKKIHIDLGIKILHSNN